MMKLIDTYEILEDYRNQIGDCEINQLFFDSKTRELIGYSYDEGKILNYIDRCSDLKKIWRSNPKAISWDGWESGIIGHIGDHMVYDVDLACENFAYEHNMEIQDAYDNWDCNVEGSRYGIDEKCTPYHIICRI